MSDEIPVEQHIHEARTHPACKFDAAVVVKIIEKYEADLAKCRKEYPVHHIAESPSSDSSMMAFLESAGSGCISGRVDEWPQLKPACKWAADRIHELKAANHNANKLLAEAADEAQAIIHRLEAQKEAK